MNVPSLLCCKVVAKLILCLTVTIKIYNTAHNIQIKKEQVCKRSPSQTYEIVVNPEGLPNPNYGHFPQLIFHIVYLVNQQSEHVLCFTGAENQGQSWALEFRHQAKLCSPPWDPGVLIFR